MRFQFFLSLSICSLAASQLFGQSFYPDSSPARYITPASRGTVGTTEYSNWDVFYSPYQGGGFANGVNYPDMAAPNGVGTLFQTAPVKPSAAPPGNSDPANPYAFWNPANPTIAQTGAPEAFIIGSGAVGNIYSPEETLGFQLKDSTPFTLGSVNFQWRTEGTLTDYSSFLLNYTVGGDTFSIAPTNFIAEYQPSGSARGFGFQNRSSVQWDLSGLGITDYTITWHAEESSNSFQEALLDTSATYTEVTPSTRAWAAGGADPKWSTPANWTGGIPSRRGNVTFGTGTSVQVDSAREISELTLNTDHSFAITGSAKLQINTGITVAAASVQDPATVSISAPIAFGAFNLIDIGANTDMTFSNTVSGFAGFYRSGSGTLRFTHANTFSGQVVIDGGETYFAGTNAYNLTTSVFSGKLILQGNAPSGATGTLGNAVSSVILGSGGSLGGEDATLLVDGAYAVGRKIYIGAGSDGKVLGGRNTGAGANFSGAVTLDLAASNVSLTAEDAADTVTFSGNITGGAAGLKVAKTGNGTVVLAGTSLNYANNTTVSAGTLRIATGKNFTGKGNMVVVAGAMLQVNGILGGTGASATLAVNGGTVGGSGTINRVFGIDLGDTLSPGDGVGTLTSMGETWGTNGKYKFEINNLEAAAGAGWDLVNINGDLSITANSSIRFILELDSLTLSNQAGLLAGFDPSSNYSWKFASATGSIIGFDESKFQIDTTHFSNFLNGAFRVSELGNSLFLNYVAVPEPTISAYLLFAFSAVGFRRLRGKHRS